MTRMNGPRSDALDRCSGQELRRIFAVAARVLERNAEAVNALNVFPVPDGDTGTNMLLTMRAVTEEATRATDDSASGMAAAMAKGALFGARGNSGVILSQFFKGLSKGLDGKVELTGADLALSLKQAVTFSYKAVSNPVEGTMLTVIRKASEAADQEALRNAPLAEIWRAAGEAAREAVARTPTLLPVLREAGVVDAGGLGLSLILEGALRSLEGEELEEIRIEAPEPVGVEVGARRGLVSQDFLRATEEEIYGYCTQFLIQGENLDVDSLQESLSLMAESAVMVGDGAMIKVHVHALDPGQVLTYAVSHGTLAQINIMNMDEQHQEFQRARLQETQAPPLAMVAVASGDGLEALFRSLGVSATVPGGDTMNPSTQDLLQAVERLSSRSVILLPNNGNIVPAALQACDLCDKTLKVVPTRSIPQGVAAAIAFNPELDVEANVAVMEKAAASVRTGEVTTAVRSVKLGDIPVKAGQVIGLLDRELVAAGQDVATVMVDLLGKAEVAEGNLVTLYWGSPSNGEEAEKLAEEIQSRFQGTEVEVVRGGQPHYHYILSIE